MSEANQHPHASELKTPDGQWRYTNALADQTSPYLLQHAHNPVDWYPWGEQAFEESARTGRPIFLSVGYSTCYWCHVMERQVFENPAIAEQMNRLFVNVKVDREERPDIDDVYMHAVHTMGQQGGWPMSVFLTPPDGDDRLLPFYAGTYFPPTPMHGRMSFPQLLDGLHDAWENRRDEVMQTARRVAESVQRSLGRAQVDDDDAALSVGVVQAAANQIFRSYDDTHGGFGGAPKFPVPNNLLFLIAVYRGNPQPEVWHAIAHTLDRMARGGMYDQVGGGFHRYSTDAKWLVPHFEKMLYDNGQLVETYLDAQALQPDAGDEQFYLRVVRDTCDYVLREMTDDTGAFWSAQDAEVDAAEGGSYLWTPHEVDDAIDDQALASLARRMYGLDLGTNFTDPHLPGAKPTNVLYAPSRWDIFARGEDLPLDELIARRRRINHALLHARDQRKQPATDDKVLASWNGMMIAGLARAGAQFDDAHYLDAAKRAATAILTHMRADDGGLLRTMRKREAKIDAFLEDYAFFVHALIELHRADSSGDWLDHARQLMRIAHEKFAAEQGGYYDMPADQTDLFVRTRSSHDGAVSSGNSQMAHNLIDLYRIAGDEAYLEQAIALLQSFASAMHRMGQGMSHMCHALLRAIEIAPDHFDASEAPPPRRRPVSIELSERTLDLSAGEAALAITLTIDHEYHLNAHDQSENAGVIATAVELLDAPGIEMTVDYPAGAERQFDFADHPVSVYEGKVVLTARFRRTGDAAADASPTLALQYQVCTDLTCLEPRQGQLPVIFTGLK